MDNRKKMLNTNCWLEQKRWCSDDDGGLKGRVLMKGRVLGCVREELEELRGVPKELRMVQSDFNELGDLLMSLKGYGPF
jgi:hypothetical protein